MFNNYNDWKFTGCTVINEKTGIILWTANGAFFFDGYNGTVFFGLIERHFLWRAFTDMCKRKALGYDK